MIQYCGNQVALTLVGSSSNQQAGQSPNNTLTSLMSNPASSSLVQPNEPNNLPLSLASSTSTRIRPYPRDSSSSLQNSQRHITPPLPANDSTLIEFEKSRFETIRKMLADELEFLAKLRKDEKYPNEKENEINATINRIKKLEEQLSSANESKHTVARYIVPLDIASFTSLRLNNSTQSSSSRTSSSSSINQQLNAAGGTSLSNNNGNISRKHLSAENLHYFTQLPSADVDCQAKKSHSFGQYDHHSTPNTTSTNLTIMNNSIESALNSTLNSTTSSKDSNSFYSSSSYSTSTKNLSSQLEDPAEFDASSLLNAKPNIDILLEPKNVHLLLNFLHYLFLDKQDINPLLFYILTDLFKKVCENPKFSDTSTSLQNHIRKWAFEIYSTFLFNDSPLRLNCDFTKDQAQFNELLNENFTSATTLVNTIFDPYLEKCKELINGQIEQFKRSLSMANGLSGSTTAIKKIQPSLIVECLTSELAELPHQVSLSASSSNTLLTQITILVSYLLNSNSTTLSNSSIQAIAQLTCFTSILYHCFPQLLVSSDENANTLASKLIPVPVYLSFHQTNTSHSNQLQHKRHKSLPASSSAAGQPPANHSSAAIPYHLSSSSQPTGNHHNPPTATVVNHHQPKTLANASNNQIFLRSGHVFSLLNTTKPNNCSGCNQSIWAMFGWHCQLCLLNAHHWCLRATAEEHPCPGPIDQVLDQCNDLNANNLNNLQHLSSGSSTRSKSKNKSTGGRLLENILKNRAESLKHKKEEANNKCTRKKSDPSIGSSGSLFGDFASKNKYLHSPSSSSNSDLDDNNQFGNEHSFSIFNDNMFNRDDQILLEHDSRQLSPSNSGFLPTLPPRSASSVQLSSEQKKANKRQDIFNELVSTERTHVKNLQVLNDIFYRPIVAEQLLNPDQIDYVFSNHAKLYEIHSQIYQLLKTKKRKKEKNKPDWKYIQDQLQFPQKYHGLHQDAQQTSGEAASESAPGSQFELDIAHLLVQIFEGDIGDRLEEAASVFCAKQTIGGDILRNKLKKDSKLSSFLAEAETHKRCRRLQLKDMLASCFQRITKYPLLMENLMKEIADKESEEYKLIERACKRSKSILHKVNECVKQAENKQKLLEIQRKIEKSFNDPPVNYDLSEKTLIHEGQLTFRVVKKSFEVLVLLCTDVLIFLLKEGDKYTLKNINKNTHPIVQIKNVITRRNATDSRGFYLISKQENLMYEFVATSEAEKNNWVKQIDEAAVKQGGGVRSGQIKLRDLTFRDEQQFKDENSEQIITKLIKDQDLMEKGHSADDRLLGESKESQENNSLSKVRTDGTISFVKDEDVNLSYNRKYLRSSQPIIDHAYSSTSRGQAIIERIQAIESEVEKLLNEKQQLLSELNRGGSF